MFRFSILLAAITSWIGVNVAAQTPAPVNLSDEYKIAPQNVLKCSHPKNQGSTGTCWSFATASFLESEAIRMGKGEHDLSEMYFVAYNYVDKADKLIRYQGNSNFGEGSLSHDVIRVAERHGIVPEEVYSGLKQGQGKHNHKDLFSELDSIAKQALKEKSKYPDWKEDFTTVISEHLGELPDSFGYQGKEYTPESFAKEVLGFDPANYVEITSFSHHPFYRQFVLEVPDNWANGIYYNLPLDEMEETIDFALANGFTIAWDGDVSEKGFSHRTGLATLPLSAGDDDELDAKDGLNGEISVTQELRQEAFDQFKTTDDHLMHLVGTYTDDSGKTFYLTKNSWGNANPFEGYLYMSKPYIRMKTVGILVHKDAIPQHIKEKLGF